MENTEEVTGTNPELAKVESEVEATEIIVSDEEKEGHE